MQTKYLVFGSPLIEEEEIQEVVETLRSGWIGTGPKVAKFEEMFKKHVGSKHAVALNSCTAGLHLSMLVLGVGPGDGVITTPMTFAATANSIIHCGGRPIFVDVNPETMNIEPSEIERYITDNCDYEKGVLRDRKSGCRIKAILPVHLAGRPCDMDSIAGIAKKYGLYVIEDAAHATESVYKGRKIGTIGDLAAFSFYVTKNVVTGEGGMVTTDNEEWADKIKIYGLHGMSKGAWKRFSDAGYKHYQVVYPGYKYNMMDIQAALGIHQLGRVEGNLKIREAFWAEYDRLLEGLPLKTPAPPEPDTRHARHLYTVLIDINKTEISRDDVMERLHEKKIGTGIHYIALHLHPYYQQTYGYKRGDFPAAEYISDRTLSLPLSPKLSMEDVRYVAGSLKEILVGG